MKKHFKTHRQQIKILRDRGMDIPTGKEGSKAMRILERYNYYDLINGYSDLFLSGDDYIPGTKLEEIVYLKELDLLISKEILSLMLIYEKKLKNKCAYFFSAENKDEDNPYLNYQNYNISLQNKKGITSAIKHFAQTIEKYSEKRNQPIHHYLHNKIDIPLWVIIERMTFGNINYFFKVLKPTVQNNISNQFKNEFINNDSINFSFKKLIEESNYLVNIYRNKAAHGERIYCAQVYNFSSINFKRRISDYFNITSAIFDRNEGHVFELLSFLYFLVDKSDFESCINNIQNGIEDVFENNKINSISKNTFLEELGFTHGVYFDIFD